MESGATTDLNTSLYGCCDIIRAADSPISPSITTPGTAGEHRHGPDLHSSADGLCRGALSSTSFTLLCIFTGCELDFPAHWKTSKMVPVPNKTVTRQE
ncbi:hypothetical protein JOB18_036705 [Solea senegalensis]|uniref:Uncharacterized protein n=1 Tax=Solea senegalensis TaxID=28829 RepID=A0AAV6R6D8_SOLSE|nr:hypothetical protein JOB18_036705 [Solea senegalensis]